MSDHLFGILDLGIVVVAVLGLAVWQLVSITREIARDLAAKADSPEGAGHPVGEHRLDDR